MTRRRRSRSRSTRLIELLGKLCYAGALIMVLLIIATLIPRGSGDGDDKTASESPRTTIRPFAPAGPEASDETLADVLGATPTPRDAAVVGDDSFSGPYIVAPPTLQVAPQTSTPISDISIRDDDAAAAGAQIGVIVYTPNATFDITAPGRARLYREYAVGDGRGTFWMPIMGTVDEVNAALSSLVYHADGEIGPSIVIAAGDSLGPDKQLRKARRTIPLRPLL